jgi:hypothetical protein
MLKKITCLVLFFTIANLNAQDLKLVKGTSQRINGGAAPRWTVNYLVTIKKTKKFNWHIDSVVNVASKKAVLFHVVKVDDPNAVSPNYNEHNTYNKSDKGIFQLSFSSYKSMGNRRGGDEQMVIEEPIFTEGAIIYYQSCGKKKKLQVAQFEKLETVNTP